MKIRMMTFHTPKNYGAVLQALSLMKALELYSDDVKIIDYNTPHLRSMYPLIRRPASLKGAVKTALMLPSYFKSKKRHQRFEKFVEENLNLTERFESTEALCKHAWDADVFVTGSDQVFNPSRIPEERKAFYLGFLPQSATRISYAGSFGVSTVEERKKQEVSGYLNLFSAIGVREFSGAEIVRELTSKEPTLLLDPVFLNDANFWRKRAKKSNCFKKKYLLYYRLLGTKEADVQARSIAKRLNLKLVVITNEILRVFMNATVLHDVGPGEFLDLYDNADFVVTDSFHGIAFSLLYEKQFVFLDESKKTNDRGLNLLSEFNIRDVAYIENFSMEKKIDYDLVREIMESKREECLKFLKAHCSDGD